MTKFNIKFSKSSKFRIILVIKTIANVVSHTEQIIVTGIFKLTPMRSSPS